MLAALEEDIRAHGGVPIMWKTGHSFIKEKIFETKADLGLELSGHIFIVHGYYGFDDALFTALKIIESLSINKMRLSEYVTEMFQMVLIACVQCRLPRRRKVSSGGAIDSEIQGSRL